MKNIVMKTAAIAALSLAITMTACKKTETAPTTQQAATQPDLHSVMKPFVTTVANHRITGIKATPVWTTYIDAVHFYPAEEIQVFEGCSGNSGQCITKVEVLPLVANPNSPDDTTAIKQNDYSAPSTDFIGGTIWEHGDSTVIIFKYGESNVDEYFSNPAAISMNKIPYQDADGRKYLIKDATRAGRILHLSNGDYLEIPIDKNDFEDNDWKE